MTESQLLINSSDWWEIIQKLDELRQQWRDVRSDRSDRYRELIDTCRPLGQSNKRHVLSHIYDNLICHFFSKVFLQSVSKNWPSSSMTDVYGNFPWFRGIFIGVVICGCWCHDLWVFVELEFFFFFLLED